MSRLAFVLVTLRQVKTLGLPDHANDGGSHGFPPRFFHAQLLLAADGQLVDAGAQAVFLGDAFSANPAGLFHAVESWIEGALPPPAGPRPKCPG